MTAPTREAVLEALKGVVDPGGGGDIVSAGRVRALGVAEGAARFVLEVPAGAEARYAPAREEAQARLEALAGMRSVSIRITAPMPAPALGRPSEPTGPQRVPGVDRILAIASGKGGVGKSTLSANLAVALAAEGRRVGLLDADVYGPSQPRMLGVTGRPASPDGKAILPLRNHGVTLMSVGLMTNPDQATIWRGPMLMGALQQMMTQVQWGALDVLLVDLPPGTGDVQLTLAQKFRVDGAVVVSTPQDVALIDARKGIDAFGQLGVPILGLVENMSLAICPNCGHEQHFFGHGGVAREAERLGVPLLAEIPLHVDIRLASDGGAPIVATEPEGARARVFRDLARRLVAEGAA